MLAMSATTSAVLYMHAPIIRDSQQNRGDVISFISDVTTNTMKPDGGLNVRLSSSYTLCVNERSQAALRSCA